MVASTLVLLVMCWSIGGLAASRPAAAAAVAVHGALPSVAPVNAADWTGNTSDPAVRDPAASATIARRQLSPLRAIGVVAKFLLEELAGAALNQLISGAGGGSNGGGGSGGGSTRPPVCGQFTTPTYNMPLQDGWASYVCGIQAPCVDYSITTAPTQAVYSFLIEENAFQRWRGSQQAIDVTSPGYAVPPSWCPGSPGMPAAMCSVPSMRLWPGLRYCLVAASPSFFGGPRFSSRTSQVTVYYTVGNGVSSASPPGSCCVGSPNSGGYGSGSAARAAPAARLVLLALAVVAAAAVLAPLWHA